MSTSVASVTKFFPSAQNGFQTNLASTITAGATTVPLNSVAGYNNGDVAVFVVEPTSATAKQVFTGTVDTSGVQLTGVVWTVGTNQTHLGGAVVVDYTTATHMSMISKGFLAAHNQDGTHATNLALVTPKVTTGIKDAAGNLIIPTLGSSSTTSIKLSTTAVGPTYVESGCIWSGDAYGSTKAASMTAGVVYINGVRLTVAAVTARTFTASKDSYIDLANAGDGTASITYNESSNNAASQTLNANALRIGIIVTGAGNIAAATSVNQGQETMVLPIASSIPYAVTDSLGNLICPRDPQSRLLGYRQIIANQTAFTGAATQVVGLSVPVIIPAGRKIKVSLILPQHLPATAFGTGFFSIWEGTVGSGTQRQLAKQVYNNNDTTIFSSVVEAEFTPTSTSLTFNAGCGNSATGGSTTTINAASTAPAYLKVELL